MQNLLSSDINAVNDKTAQLSSFNSPKGRMIATFLIWRQGADYFLQLPRSLTPAIQKKLSMYVMRSKVTISDASDEIVSLGLAGRNADHLIKQNNMDVPENDWAVMQHQNTCIIRFPDNRYQLNTNVSQAIYFWGKLSGNVTFSGSSYWDWLTIRAGIPVITPATQEQFVLQMTNLDLLGGVSFNKGCYPGQEIVARTHYLGKQKRRMFLAHIDSDHAPEPGNEIFSEDMPGQPCGMIMNACVSPGGGYDLLAVMQLSSYETQQVHLDSIMGAKLNFLQLPYSFPTN